MLEPDITSGEGKLIDGVDEHWSDWLSDGETQLSFGDAWSMTE
jgi:hypothetical protein